MPLPTASRAAAAPSPAASRPPMRALAAARAAAVALRRPPAAVARATAAAASTPGAGAARQLQVSHILLPPGPGAEEAAEEVRAALEGGADFAALAAERSACPSAARGGALGWLAPGAAPPAFEAAAAALAPGGVGLARTPHGVHVLRLDAARAAPPEVGRCFVEELAERVAAAALDSSLSSPAGLAGVQLLDVREQWEYETAAVPGFALRPLSQIDDWLPAAAAEMDPSAETLVLCHAGVRSARAAAALAGAAGFTNVRNVVGGIDAYSAVDPRVPRY
jgi:rhodanese-related sulfurtransferase